MIKNAVKYVNGGFNGDHKTTFDISPKLSNK